MPGFDAIGPAPPSPLESVEFSITAQNAPKRTEYLITYFLEDWTEFDCPLSQIVVGKSAAGVT